MRTESKLLRVSWNPNDMNGEHLSPKTREFGWRPPSWGYDGNVGEPSLLLAVPCRSSIRSGFRLNRFATAPGRAAVPRSSRTPPVGVCLAALERSSSGDFG